MHRHRTARDKEVASGGLLACVGVRAATGAAVSSVLTISDSVCTLRVHRSQMRAPIPKKTVYRLSVYLRCLEQFGENGVQTVSSQALAHAAGVKPTQLRKDLTSFGHLGTRGLGY